ncbi:hypothetical protein [Castellaniella sp.]|uniref:hypothetical protein n=1 Tax=Castellaniella sp. TaxID=1955812 RepID=UPI002AFE2F2E|nr:hypothetical protein [Castellaniella sp.]
MHIDHSLQHFLKHSRFGRILHVSLLLAAMALQPMSAAWAAEGLTTSQTWHVLNETGIDLLGVQRLRITGPDAGAFAIEGYTGSPSGMTPSQDVFTPSLVQKTPSTPLGVNLRFTPQHSGSHQASLEVTHDGSNASPATYPLTGAGAWDVTAQASTNTIDFGEQAIGMPAMTQDAFVRAVGAYGWLKVTGAKLEGSPDFTLAQAGLANKGSTTWGTGANLEVLPAGATESTKAFTATDVSVGGLTDGAIRVRYTPTLRGPQAATLLVYHDGPGGESVFFMNGIGSRAAFAELRGNSPFNPAAATKVPNFSRTGLNSAIQTKDVYLRAHGTSGRVTYKGFKVEGSSDISVVKAGLIFNPIEGYCSIDQLQYTVPAYAASSISYGAEGERSDSFSFTGLPVTSSWKSCISPGKDFSLSLRYIPRTLGKQTATVTIYHDGNDEGFTTFEISGEAFWDARAELRGNSPFTTDKATPVTGFARTGLNSKVQTKTVYLKAYGTYGAVAYKGFKVEGSADISVATAGLVFNPDSGICSINQQIYTTTRYAASAISYGAEDGRNATFSFTGLPVTTAGYGCVTPGKDFGLTLRYTPSTLGKQSATVTIYHDGNDEGFTTFEISGEAFWDTGVELRGNTPFTTTAAAKITDFARVKLNSATQSKAIYLKALGTYGAVTYKGFKVEGSEDFSMAKAGLVFNPSSGICSIGQESITTAAYAASALSYGAEDGRNATFSFTGLPVTTAGYGCVTPGKDFGLTLRYVPRTLGKHTAAVTIYHDGNAQGFTTFDISGEAY